MFRDKFFLPFCFCIITLFYMGIAGAQTTLEDLNNTPISWDSLKGKWVFINIWASWCGPCVDEIAELNRFYQANQKNDIAVFAVNYDAVPIYKQQRLVRKFSIQYPSLKPSALSALHLDDQSVVPVTYVFNPEGQLATTLYGGQTTQDFIEAMKS